MQGPSAAAIRSRRAPRPVIAATAASITPPSAPRHPACTAPTTRRVGIGQQDWRAIGREDAEDEAGRARHHRVRRRALAIAPRRLDHRGSAAVMLADRAQGIRLRCDGARGPVPVDCHPPARVTRGEAAIERREWTFRYPPLARQKAVAYGVHRAERSSAQRGRTIGQRVTHEPRRDAPRTQPVAAGPDRLSPAP